MGLLPDILHLSGLVIELIGVIITMLRFEGTFIPWEIPGILLSAFVRGRRVIGAAHWEMTKDKAINVLQGLAFMGLGFVVQIIGASLAVYLHINHPGIEG